MLDIAGIPKDIQNQVDSTILCVILQPFFGHREHVFFYHNTISCSHRLRELFKELARDVFIVLDHILTPISPFVLKCFWR
jgi:hypothetical protein